MNLDRLRRFIGDMTSLVGGAWQDKDEAAILEVGAKLLGELVKHDDWLPEAMAKCPPHGYAQNLLWCDPFERFSVVSFVSAPSVSAPVQELQVWVLAAMLRGSETWQRLSRDSDTGALTKGQRSTLVSGDIDVLLLERCDIHQVTNALSDRTSLGIHVYGGNIGGYTNQVLPNLWDRSAEIR